MPSKPPWERFRPGCTDAAAIEERGLKTAAATREATAPAARFALDRKRRDSEVRERVRVISHASGGFGLTRVVWRAAEG
jgi:hypothetical protein